MKKKKSDEFHNTFDEELLFYYDEQLQLKELQNKFKDGNSEIEIKTYLFNATNNDKVKGFFKEVCENSVAKLGV